MSDTSLIPSSALAHELGIHRRTLARWIAKGETPVPRVFHGRLYFERVVSGADEMDVALAARPIWLESMESPAAMAGEASNASAPQRYFTCMIFPYFVVF